MINTRENKGIYLLTSATFLLLLIFVISFALGKYPVSPRILLHVLWSKITNSPQDWSNEIELVIFKIRMPRIFAGALIGAGLSAAGAAYQGLFRNPMVSPDMLGASAGAGFGAALSLYLGLGFVFVSINAFIFGIIAVSISYFISLRVRHNPTLGMVLAGIMIGSLFSAATSYIKLVADPNDVLPRITYWLMGSISSIRLKELLFASIPILSGMFILFLLRWKMNLITTGEDEARTMGINTNLMRTLVVAAATLITASCVSISGMIGWVGLVIPHFSRLLVGHDYRILLPMSMVMGAGFMMIVDNFARLLTTSEIPIGILTAFIGAPFFLYLILKRGSEI